MNRISAVIIPNHPLRAEGKESADVIFTSTSIIQNRKCPYAI